MKDVFKPWLAIAIVVLVAGCSSTKLQEKPPAPMAAPAPAAPVAPPPPMASPAPPPQVASDPLDDPTSILAKRSIYFDFDQSAIKGEFVPLIEAHGHYLVDHASRRVRIEGNCDERGSREYNLALGQRRADALRERLTLLGVPDARVETVSYGKEKPKATGHDEASWAENRRDDIIYSAK